MNILEQIAAVDWKALGRPPFEARYTQNMPGYVKWDFGELLIDIYKKM